MLSKKDILYLNTEFKDELLREIRNEMVGRFDAVMFELKAIREDMAAATYRQSIHSDTLENHEERLVGLENPHLAQR